MAKKKSTKSEVKEQSAKIAEDNLARQLATAERYQETQATQAETYPDFGNDPAESEETVGQTANDLTEPEPTEQETPEAESKKEASTDTPPKAETTETVSEDIKPTVPLDALHKERELRKDAEYREKLIQQELQGIRRELDLLRPTSQSEQQVDLSEMDDEQKRDYLINKRLADMEQRLQTSEAKNVEYQRQSDQNSIDSKVAKSDKELFDAGFPGFKDLFNNVDYHVSLMPDLERQRAIDGFPETYKEIYKTVTFPAMKAHFVNPATEKKSTDKEELKAGIVSASSSGKKPPAPESVEDLPYSEYLKISTGNTRQAQIK
jgi:hypothetical protein